MNPFQRINICAGPVPMDIDYYYSHFDNEPMNIDYFYGPMDVDFDFPEDMDIDNLNSNFSIDALTSNFSKCCKIF